MENTKRKAFLDLLESKVRTTKAKKVFMAIMEHGPISRRMVSQRTGIYNSTVCGAIPFLVSLKLVEVAYEAKCKASGETVEYLQSIYKPRGLK